MCARVCALCLCAETSAPYVQPQQEDYKAKEQYKEKMEEDNLAKLESLIVKHKDDLWCVKCGAVAQAVR